MRRADGRYIGSVCLKVNQPAPGGEATMRQPIHHAWGGEVLAKTYVKSEKNYPGLRLESRAARKAAVPVSPLSVWKATGSPWASRARNLVIRGERDAVS